MSLRIEHLRVLSISYRNCSVDQRAQYSLTKQVVQDFNDLVDSSIDMDEFVILSTCNRTEVYFISNTGIESYDRLFKLLQFFKGHYSPVPKLLSVKACQGQLALVHLLEVSNGIHSQIPGDIQVFHQLKLAFLEAELRGYLKDGLRKIKRLLTATHKEVAHDTELFKGAASVTHAAKLLIDSFPVPKTAPIGVVGLGKTGKDLIRTLLKSGFKNIQVTNRSADKFDDFAALTEVRFIPFEHRKRIVQECRVIVSAVGARKWVFQSTDLDDIELLEFKYLIDLGVPRGVDPLLEKEPGVVLYTIDEIQDRNNDALTKRREQITHAQAIIKGAVLRFEKNTGDHLNRKTNMVYSMKNDFPSLVLGQHAQMRDTG